MGNDKFYGDSLKWKKKLGLQQIILTSQSWRHHDTANYSMESYSKYW